MLESFRIHWKEYLMEAWGLGTFMASAIVFTILIEHPDLPIRQLIPNNDLVRRFLIGIAMGFTAIGIIYSPWGKRSGAHLNPAVTLSFLRLGKIEKIDAFFYIIFQFIGGYLGVVIFKIGLDQYIANDYVRYAVTVPGTAGVLWAVFLEAFISFLLLITVLWASNQSRIARYTGILVGMWLTLFITFEAPFSGMSINPARTLASALPANIWDGLWLYFAGPILGMLLAAEVFIRVFKTKSKRIQCHMSGQGHSNCVCLDCNKQ